MLHMCSCLFPSWLKTAHLLCITWSDTMLMRHCLEVFSKISFCLFIFAQLIDAVMRCKFCWPILEKCDISCKETNLPFSTHKNHMIRDLWTGNSSHVASCWQALLHLTFCASVESKQTTGNTLSRPAHLTGQTTATHYMCENALKPWGLSEDWTAAPNLMWCSLKPHIWLHTVDS